MRRAGGFFATSISDSAQCRLTVPMPRSGYNLLGLNHSGGSGNAHRRGRSANFAPAPATVARRNAQWAPAPEPIVPVAPLLESRGLTDRRGVYGKILVFIPVKWEKRRIGGERRAGKSKNQARKGEGSR